MDAGTGSPRAASGRVAAIGRAATAAAVVSAVATAAAIGLHLRTPAAALLSVSDVVVALAYPLLAAVILRAQPANRAGRLLLPTALLGPYLLAGVYAVDAVVVRGVGGLLPDAATWLAMWGFAPYWVIVSLVPLHLPDGELPSPRWRHWVRVLVTLQTVGVLVAMTAPISPDVSAELTNPLGVDVPVSRVGLALAGFGSFLVGGPVAGVSLVLRLRRARGADRSRLLWVLCGVATLVVCGIASIPFAGTFAGEALMTVGLAVVPTTIGIAVLRHRLFDRDVVLNRAIVYGVSTAFVLATYAAIVAIVGGVATGTRWALPVTALAALAAAGVRERLQHGVDRLLHGERRDPAAVMARTGDRLDGVEGPVEALDALAGEVARILRVPWVAIVPADADLPATTAGVASPHHHFLPLHVHGHLVGELRIGHRHPGERLRRSDRPVLAEVARRAALLVWSAGLLEDVSRSRDEAQRRGEQIVLAREEERRRIRRDLHDGVGPELAGMALQMERLGRRLDDPELAARAAALRDQLRRTVAAVRGVVDELRPPALDELGLAGALRAHALVGPDGADAAVVEVASDPLDGLPAAVEVAAYRIATEALTNAVRHGHATRSTVELRRRDGELLVRVSDDGRGIGADAVPGVGTTSMAERAAELGGSLEISPGVDGGTTVTARLPEGTS